jgi:Lrp/AsnC family leucine-responsive transcriptional regulator
MRLIRHNASNFYQKKADKFLKLQRHEIDILTLLQQYGRISNVELARKVGLSESPCLRKTKLLEEQKVVTGYSAQIDPKKVGCQISAIIMVNLNQSADKIQSFFDQVQQEKRVVECLAITGTADLMLKVLAKDIDDFSELTLNGLLRNPSVKDISSCIVLREIKKNTPVPVFN